MASVEFEAIRNKVDAVTVYLIHIHFDAFFEIPEMDFYFATTAYVEAYLNGEDIKFEDYLRDYPSIRHQTDRGNDIAEFVLNNPSNEIYARFQPYEQIIERGYVKIYQAFEIEKDYYEHEIVFVGYLDDFTVNEADKTVDFTVFSDMSRPNHLVGNTILTRERCRAEFNYGGVHPPDALRLCTWQVIQGGRDDYCSHYLTGVDSCEAHNNPHQFAAVEGLATAEVTIVSSTENPQGFPYGTNGACFTENAFIVMADGSVKSINLIQEGDLILGVDLFDGFQRKPAKVLGTEKHIVTEIVVAEFESGTVLEVSKDHPFRIKDATFARIGTLEGKRVLGQGKATKAEFDTVKSLTKSIEVVSVFTFRTELGNYIVTDANRLFEYDVKNSKPHTPIYY